MLTDLAALKTLDIEHVDDLCWGAEELQEFMEAAQKRRITVEQCSKWIADYEPTTAMRESECMPPPHT